MTIGSNDGSSRERLSALADGELDAREHAACHAAWASDSSLRADWHAWHLIGDVLRSEDLASDPKADLAFCSALRVRLRNEPVVLAPSAGAAAVPTRRRMALPGGWMTGAAMAAGVVLVVGTFAIVGPVAGPDAVPMAAAPPAQTVAQAPAPAEPAVVETSAPTVAVVADGQMIRDAQLDRYLDAHKQFAGSSALGLPSAFLRSATVHSAAR
jgi:sigma-E factor negative regulatory protein RseA